MPVAAGAGNIANAAMRDNLDVFSQMMRTPTYFVFPLAIVLLTCLPFDQELANRFVSSIRVRMSLRVHVGLRLIRVVGYGFATGFLYSFCSFATAFLIWPRIGNPNIAPEVYFMTASEAAADSLERITYSALLEGGPLWFGIAYSAWVGFGGAVYAAMGLLALTLIGNRLLALSVPVIIYFGGTVVASLAGWPFAAPLYSLFPFGLNATDPLLSAAPTLVLGVGVVCVGVLIFIRLPRLSRMT